MIKEANGTRYRLLGVGISGLQPVDGKAAPHTLDQRESALAKAELAIDKLRDKFGRHAVERGIALKGERSH